MRTQELFNFIRERYGIWERRRDGLPKPWTKDPILQQYRFCNVYRELDTVTVWIRENWREPNAADPNLWFAMTVARMFNLPTTLAAIGYPVPFKGERVRKIVRDIQAEGRNAFSAAYMIRCDCQQPGKTKVDYLVDKVFTPMWKARKTITLTTLENLQCSLVPFYGMGSFMAGQVVADTKFSKALKNAPDWWTFAAPGPGSLRGLNYVCGLEFNAHWRVEDWIAKLAELQAEIDPLVKKAGMPRISAQDLQNCLCEMSKYQKVKLGFGRPKQRYSGV